MHNNFGNRVSQPVEKFLHDLEAGEHGCIFYFSKDDMQKIHFAFVKSGLENNWGVVYVTAIESVEEIRKAMQRHGINTLQYENAEEREDNSLLIVKGEELYKNAENPDIDNWKNVAKSISDMFISKGKKGVRIAADLSSYFLSHGFIHQWHELEYVLEKKLSSPISILCAYDSHSPELLETDVLKYYDRLYNENKEFIDAHSFTIYVAGNKSIIFRI
jgi:hypothetical protein